MKLAIRDYLTHRPDRNLFRSPDDTRIFDVALGEPILLHSCAMFEPELCSLAPFNAPTSRVAFETAAVGRSHVLTAANESLARCINQLHSESQQSACAQSRLVVV